MSNPVASSGAVYFYEVFDQDLEELYKRVSI